MKNLILILIIGAAILGACYYDKEQGNIDFEAMKYDFVSWFSKTETIVEEKSEEPNIETESCELVMETIEENVSEEIETVTETIEEAIEDCEQTVDDLETRRQKFIEERNAKKKEFEERRNAKMKEIEERRNAKMREIEEKRNALMK